MSNYEAALATFSSILEELQVTHGARRGQVFGQVGLKVGSRVIAVCLTNGHLSVKLPPEEYAETLKLDGVRPFVPEGTPMTTWIEIPHEYGDQWREYVMKSLRYIMSQPVPKRTRSKTKGKA
ncbi:MAG: hypothetical protein OHK0023_00520 [Anaerolineae bacterium]